MAENKPKQEQKLSKKDKILQGKKVKIRIPSDPINKNKTVFVSVNGVPFYLATGKQIEVPEAVAEAWQNSYEATIEAYEKIKADNEIK